MAAAAIGFMEHTGWAVAVAVVGAGDSFDVVARERIATLDPALPRQAYHAVAEMGFDRGIIETVRESAVDCSEREIVRLAGELKERGHGLAIAAVPVGTGRIPESVDAILASHSLLHAAEGEMFREALAEAAARCGLRVLRPQRKDILSEAAAIVGLALPALQQRLNEIGRSVGPPWQADQKAAAAAAWAGLVGAAP
jgi:hypothetical protein